MTRAQLEHLIRASSVIADDEELVIIGSQAILASTGPIPAELTVSREADLWPKNHPERWELIDGSIGEGSPFHETFGIYAQGVGPETATLPAGWEARLVPIRGPGTRGATGWALEAHDLVVAKLVAGREKDRAFASVALRHRLVGVPLLRARLDATTLAPELRAIVVGRLEAAARTTTPPG